jgi:hypothetical protein
MSLGMHGAESRVVTTGGGESGESTGNGLLLQNLSQMLGKEVKQIETT